MQTVCKTFAVLLERAARVLQSDARRRQVPAGRRHVRMPEPVAHVMVGNTWRLSKPRGELAAQVVKVQAGDAGGLTRLEP